MSNTWEAQAVSSSSLRSWNQRYSLRRFQEDPEYEQPPDLPPRSEEFLELDAPPLPERSAQVDSQEDEVGDEGEYEELVEPPPAPLTGLRRPSVKCQTVNAWDTNSNVFSHSGG